MHMRTESDSIGSRQVPASAYYGVQSLRGAENFRITGQLLRPEFINAMAMIKKTCAICNHAVGELDDVRRNAIVSACDEIMHTPARWQHRQVQPLPLKKMLQKQQKMQT